jgi:hypothetical protein
MSNEMTKQNRPDFTENKKWFDVKVLTDGKVEGNMDEMSRRSYTDRVKECFMALDIHLNAYGHWGQISGPPAMELEEVPQEFIRIIGTSVCCVALLIVVCLTSSFLYFCRQLGSESAGGTLQRKAGNACA